MGTRITSLKMDKELYKKFRIKCVKEGISYREGMDEALKMWCKTV